MLWFNFINGLKFCFVLLQTYFVLLYISITKNKRKENLNRFEPQHIHVYRIKLDSSVTEIARKETQDAVDGAGLSGRVKIY